jgi:hypothetical protein
MIRFALTCDRDHRFDSWFRSGEAYDRLRLLKQVACPFCGSAEIAKSLMSPSVVSMSARTGPQSSDLTAADSARQDQQPAPISGQPPTPSLGPLAPATQMEQALARMRREVEANSEYVGMNFAHEARAIHDGDAPVRAIYGEAKPEEARKLIEDGVPVAPLPFLASRKAH